MSEGLETTGVGDVCVFFLLLKLSVGLVQSNSPSDLCVAMLSLHVTYITLL